jgi:hypothetical protein
VVTCLFTSHLFSSAIRFFLINLNALSSALLLTGAQGHFQLTGERFQVTHRAGLRRIFHQAVMRVLIPSDNLSTTLLAFALNFGKGDETTQRRS